MQIIPYLSFNGQCEAAFQFYEQCLNAKILAIFRYEGSPMKDQVSPEWQQKVMHARLQVGSAVVMGSDSTPDRFEAPKGFSMSVSAADAAEAEKVFQALAEKGKVTMPIQQTFWSVRFGMLIDHFGIPWMVNCEQGA